MGAGKPSYNIHSSSYRMNVASYRRISMYHCSGSVCSMYFAKNEKGGIFWICTHYMIYWTLTLVYNFCKCVRTEPRNLPLKQRVSEFLCRAWWVSVVLVSWYSSGDLQYSCEWMDHPLLLFDYPVQNLRKLYPNFKIFK